MSGGNAAAPPLLWPKGLIRPESEQKLVYLDFNQWIYLAKAAVGLPQGKPYEQALQQCRAAHADGRVIFPLSGAHYMEMAGVKDPAQRRNVAPRTTATETSAGSPTTSSTSMRWPSPSLTATSW